MHILPFTNKNMSLSVAMRLEHLLKGTGKPSQVAVLYIKVMWLIISADACNVTVES